MNRRTFLESSLATGILASLPSATLAATHQISKVGVQLYTVRDLMKTDFAGTIAKVASIGYKEVEFAGYYDHSPKDVRAILDKVGLTAPACHVGMDVVENHWPETIDAAHTIGHTFIVCPWIDDKDRNSADSWKRIIEGFNKAGEASKKANIQFAYHNHWWEFGPNASLGGKLPYDYLLASTDPNFVKMEMDLGWISVAGQDPVAYFKRYPGRFPLVHVKDFKSLPKIAPDQLASFNSTTLEEGDMTAPGSGIIDWKRIFSHSDEAGIQHYFLEHDMPKDPFATLTDGYKYLSTLRF
ncbi:MAG TPA: sugar phosphate isomerase/epimerase [Candidatus Acidoferrum sp.]|nr:sugar phosphate isomerase/epimerase [Candidatus Acidoferrum sp.]